ncbi:hypothetical protein C8J55DRAFT_374315, partial [Lentinula edodes]
IEVETDASEFDAARGAHTGCPGRKSHMGTKADKEKEYTVSELIDMGFKHIQWDGSTPVPIIDCFGRIIAVLAGQPEGSYGSELHEAFCFMQKEASDSGLGKKSKEGPHKCGLFPVLLRGVTMGMGNPHPVSLNPKTMTHLLNRLVGHAAVQRMAKYQNSAFGLWAPRIYEEYRNVHDTMHSKLNLPENFPGTIFAAAAFNLG